MGELILKIINGQTEDMAEPFSQEIRKLVQEMLDTDCEKRPNINEILQKPFIMRYIKMNLIKQMDLNQLRADETKTSIEIDDYLDKEGLIDIENITFKKEEKIIVEDNRKQFSENRNSAQKYNSDCKDIKVEEDEIISKNSESPQIENNLDTNSTIKKIEKTKRILQKLLGFNNFTKVHSRFSVKHFFNIFYYSFINILSEASPFLEILSKIIKY